MQALRFHEHGDPSQVLQLEDIADPEPQSGDVLVRMLASPMNPSDRLFIEGRYGQPARFPQTPGFEGVGIVEASGGGLLGKLLVGKRVAAINRGGGNWAELTTIPAKQAIPLPDDLSLEQAATFFVNPVTAVVMTRKVLAVSQGEWLLQSAAASSLGQMIVRLGKHVGFRTLNIVRRPSQVDELKRLGADEVLVFDATTDDSQTLIDAVRDRTDGGVGAAIDPVAGVVGSALVQCLTARGRLLSYGTLTDAPLTIEPRSLIDPQARVEGFWLGKWMDEQSLFRKMQLIREVTTLIRSGILNTEIADGVLLSQTTSLLARNPGGKSLILMNNA